MPNDQIAHFHSIIIGSGQAGTPLAFKLARAGRKVALIERRHPGGTCVNVGCTPTKAYVASARRIWAAAHGQDVGVVVPEGAYADLRKIKARKNALVKDSRDGILSGIEKDDNITYFQGEAKFTGHKTVEVNGQQLTAEKVFINTGGQSVIPPVFDKIPHLTNEGMLELEEVPAHLIVVGGSYIGMEFAQMFCRFGSQVTVIERESHLVPKEDESISDQVRLILEEEDIKIHLASNVIKAIENDDHSITLTLENAQGKEQLTGTHVLVAVGRKPNTGALNLQASGITTDEKGFIKVNDYLQTSQEGIFALGDCNGQGAFTHTSYNDFQVVWASLYEEYKPKVSDRVFTYCMYTDPPLARAGMTKKQALQQGFRLLEASYPMSQVARAKEKAETRGMMSAIIDADTGLILGAAILGTGGDEAIGFLLQAMHHQITYDKVRQVMIPHPTLTELIPTMLMEVKEAE